MLESLTVSSSPAASAAGSASFLPLPADSFVHRHIGPSAEETATMLAGLGFADLDSFIAQVVPPSIRLASPLGLPEARSESAVLAELRAIAGQNQVFRSFIGMGYSDCFTPPVIQRNILENPGWYTPYTPYQAEISQGRLEALFNFQTLISDLTALPIANASLLDEATAAAEAMHLCHNAKPDRTAFFVSQDCHPQTIEVVRTRARPLGIEILVGDHETFQFTGKVFGALVQYPATDGAIFDYENFARQAHAAGALVVVAADLLALTLLRPPGEFGADVALGSSQRFGVPLGYGGPHAAFFATTDACKRLLPGRLVGLSKDAQGRPALRLALQTREQHIRREKATSNVCTAQALLASMASMYAVYHGPEGLKGIARRIYLLTTLLARGLAQLGLETGRAGGGHFFDTLKISLGDRPSSDLAKLAEASRMNFRVFDPHTIGISLDETTIEEDVADILAACNGGKPPAFSLAQLAAGPAPAYPAPLARATPFLRQAVFNRYHSETEMLRYIRRLEGRDLSLTTSMIPLGSCTMKLNGAAEMLPVTWPELARLHPYAPLHQTRGWQALFRQLEDWLAEITGFAGVSLQPNSGAQGEYSGLLVIRKYHETRGQAARNVCLIPASAHGTNPASAAMAGLKIVSVACDVQGNIDLADLRGKAQAHAGDLAALMATYPSTHGVFEEDIAEICKIIHDCGGQVYMDGANLNAQTGLCRPAGIGADVCHINLHKTFCIPHGGGGPGMGPICVAEHLVPFLPGHPVVNLGGEDPIGAVSAAPWGSAGILMIPWVYIALMGGEGLAQAAKCAILNANHVARRLHPFFPVLYKGRNGLIAHECIVDFRRFKSVTVEDAAKRLMDYGFHAPTISFPVAGTMMIEPTESESMEELDRLCDALIAIHAEIQAIESGKADPRDNLLKNAPHTAEAVVSDQWARPYSREQAAFPAPWTRQYKFWPAVARVDNVHGDRNLVCACQA
ncbi:MAG TPA: aminomethyl-transferring glycine dehydrogenase [Candidatus Acidoferrum sp.]|nr:aminomethyl-transferring glycine dehydrogenase [Candidatus Acidoferrum sp.]